MFQYVMSLTVSIKEKDISKEIQTDLMQTKREKEVMLLNLDCRSNMILLTVRGNRVGGDFSKFTSTEVITIP